MGDLKFDEVPEEELWKRYKKTNDLNLREYFVTKYAPLVKYVAGKIAIGMPQNVDFDDLVSYGIFGLLDAIDKFDPEREIKFKTYAITRIRGSIFDELRAIDWIPRSVRQKAREMEKLITEMETKLGRAVEDEEIAESMGISVEELQRLVLKISGTTIVSLNDVWYLGGDDDEVPVLDSVEGQESLKPDVLLERDEVKNAIVGAIDYLPEKEKQVIVLYYYEDLTLKEIGEVLDITESRVSQLHTKAIMRLRGSLSKIKSSVTG